MVTRAPSDPQHPLVVKGEGAGYELVAISDATIWDSITATESARGQGQGSGGSSGGGAGSSDGTESGGSSLAEYWNLKGWEYDMTKHANMKQVRLSLNIKVNFNKTMK